MRNAEEEDSIRTTPSYKKIHRKYVLQEEGNIFRPRMEDTHRWHWTGATNDYYTDDSRSFLFLDFVLCKAVLSCMEKEEKEFGSSEELTIVTKEDIINYAVSVLGMEPQGREPQEAPPGGDSKGSSQKPSPSQKLSQKPKSKNKSKTSNNPK